MAGYACGLTFSPDGSLIASGDSEGKLFVWDYQTAKLLRKLPGVHKGPIATVAWHPHVSSGVVTGGWDGTIRIWD